MPITASIVDFYRHFLADGGKLIFASENGVVIDRREPETNVFQIPANYNPSFELKGKK